jgi:hypothetical protein
MPLKEKFQIKIDYERTPDGFQRILDSNLKVVKALYIPVLNDPPDLNNNTDEPGAIGLLNDLSAMVFYDGSSWNQLGLPSGGTSDQYLRGDGTFESFNDDVQSFSDARYLQLSGGTLLGDVQQASLPVNATSLVNKSYVDNILTGISWKQEVIAATISNITLSGLQTIDEVSMNAGDRILVKNQTDQTNNGIYIVASSAWTRSTDANTGAEIGSAAVLVRNGATNKNTQWTCTNSADPVIGTDNINFGQISASGTYTNGTGISLTANAFSLDLSYTDARYIPSTGGTVTGSLTISSGYGISIGGFISGNISGTNGSFGSTALAFSDSSSSLITSYGQAGIIMKDVTTGWLAYLKASTGITAGSGITVNLPNHAGTLAVLGDNLSSFTNDAGFLTSASSINLTNGGVNIASDSYGFTVTGLPAQYATLQYTGLSVFSPGYSSVYSYNHFLLGKSDYSNYISGGANGYFVNDANGYTTYNRSNLGYNYGSHLFTFLYPDMSVATAGISIQIPSYNGTLALQDFVTQGTADSGGPGDANQAITVPYTWLILSDAITANRNINIPTGTQYIGTIIKIHTRQASGTYNWLPTGATIKTASGTVLTSFAYASLYILEYDGSFWTIINS